MPAAKCKCGAEKTAGPCKLCDMFAAAAAPGGTGTTGWPMVSNALSVSPRQAAAANARAKAHGIGVVYDSKGKCHISDRGNRKKLMRLEGMHDNHGGYGD
jgi:hypothetical protein